MVHDIGEIWANILHVLAALVDARGFSQNARTNPDQDGGNVVWFYDLRVVEVMSKQRATITACLLHPLLPRPRPRVHHARQRASNALGLS